MPDVPTMTMNDGRTIPQFGFGVFQVPEDDTARIVGEALDAGYRMIDTAWGYMNEAGVGEGLAASALDRDDVFVTTKVWNSYQGRDKTLESFDASMKALRLDELDLLLIHWPAPANDLYVETWQTFVELRDSGRVRSIGVSNFEPEHLGRIIDATGVVPAVNQVELHPWLQQEELRTLHADEAVLVEIGERHGRSAVQVTLRWELQHGIVVIPKTVHADRIVSNIDVFDFELSADEMAAIDALDAGAEGRMGPDPTTFS